MQILAEPVHLDLSFSFFSVIFWLISIREFEHLPAVEHIRLRVGFAAKEMPEFDIDDCMPPYFVFELGNTFDL